MKILKIVGIVLVILIIIIGILGLVAPKKYMVERSVVIDAPKELVFSHVKFWRNWQAWSPWARLDSVMQVTVEGNDGEKGSVYKWSGKVTGTGEMTNTGVTENAEIAYHLRFIKPFESESEGYIKIYDADGGTKVIWGMYGENPFPWNVVMLFMSMDKMIGKDFDRGLDLLKGITEQEAEAVGQYQVQKVSFPTTNYAIVREVVKFQDIKSFYTASFGTLDKLLRSKKIIMSGAPCGFYFSFDEQQLITDMAAAVPIRSNVKTGGITFYTIHADTAYMIDYYGPYDQSENAYKAIDLYMAKHGLKQGAPIIEEYITDPALEPDSSKWQTRIYTFTE